MPRKQIETKFKEKVFKELKTLKNCWFYKNVAGSIRGIPDVIICLNGSFIAMELKVGSPATKLQDYSITKIREANGTAMVVDPKNWRSVLLDLKKREK